MSAPCEVTAYSLVEMAPYVRLRHNPIQDRWVLLAPHRRYEPDGLDVMILQHMARGESPVERLIDECVRVTDIPRPSAARAVCRAVKCLAHLEFVVVT